MENDRNMLAIDIDDTLTDTALRAIERTKKLFSHPLSALELRNNFLQPGKVPQWQKADVQGEIKNILESSEFLFKLRPKIGSAHLLHKVSKNYPISCYITSRSSVFQEVTQAWLFKHQFPQARVVTRPLAENRQDWKLVYLRDNVPDARFLVDDVMIPHIKYFPAIQLLWLIPNQRQSMSLPANVEALHSLEELPTILASITKRHESREKLAPMN